MQNRDEFSSYLIENFSESLSKYGEREEIEFDVYAIRRIVH